MGMAASQARWISLAARSSNVEYEGQQINQARTALANQTSELWNQLYQMAVPIPPNTKDFTTTQYEFQIGDAVQTVKNVEAANYTDSDGITYNSYVTYSARVLEYSGVRNTNSNPQVQAIPNASSPEYWMVGTKKLSRFSDITDEDTKKSYSAMLDQIAIDWGTPAQKVSAQIATDWNNDNESNIWYWVDGDNVYFVSENGDNDTLTYCASDPSQALHYYNSDYLYQTKELSKYAVIDYDPSGRAKTIQLEGSSVVYDMATNSVTDDNAYADAMNQYNYDKQTYEKNVQDINARTEQIQTEDRTLELRLKQLDTERQALQAEMDVIKKVISKNITDTFKTFDQ